MLVKGACVFTEEHIFEQKDILVENGVITGLFAPGSVKEDGETVDAAGLFAIPGLVDLHFHGAKGYDFCDATKEAVEELAKYEASCGVLAICPATMTYGEEKIGEILDTALSHKNDPGKTLPLYASLEGVNLEGPFISKNKIGAQNPDFIIPPDIDTVGRILDRGKGLVKLIDIAPETEGAMDCIRTYSGKAVFSIAHTEADYDTASKAFENGASHVTHLYNAMQGMNHRTPGPIPAACEAGAEAELICDGIHVHPAMVRLTFKMFGPDKVILISDSMRACGLEDGEYDLGGQRVKVSGKKAVLAQTPGTIAGSVTNLYECMKNAYRFGVRREDAVRAATENPAKCIGIFDRFGRIGVGATGHFLLTDKDLDLVRIL